MKVKDTSKSTPTSSLPGDIPAEVMAKLQAAYQASGGSPQVCPEPETVLAYALEELIPEKRAQVYAHLSKCQDCLNLVLDSRSAWAEAQEGRQKVRESTPVRVQAPSWLAGFVDRMNGSLSRLFPFPRLIPVAAVLVVLALVGLGVFQHWHLTPTPSSQPSVTMTKLKPGNGYNDQGNAIIKARAGKVSPGAPVLARTRVTLPFLPLLLENEKANNSSKTSKEL